jgi:ribonuclease BN (tRNA processing enzyme)
MKITLLGTGTPAPSVERQSSGYLVDVGGDVLVLDHGPGAAHRLLEAGRHPTEVTHLFLSHMHYDHIHDCPRLVRIIRVVSRRDLCGLVTPVRHLGASDEGPWAKHA